MIPAYLVSAHWNYSNQSILEEFIMWKRAGLFCVLIISMAFVVSCDEEECPVCPDPEEIVSNYDVYLTGIGESPIYIYNTKEMAIVDSFEIDIPGHVYDLKVSNNGKHLLFTGDTRTGYRLGLYDLEIRDTIPVDRSVGEYIEMSLDGKYIALFGRSRTYFLDGDTYSILFAPYIQTYDGCFSADGTKFYCVTGTNYIRIYDMVSQSQDTIFQYVDNNGLSPGVTHIQCSYTDPKLYMSVSYFMAGWSYDSLVVYSLDSDFTTFSYGIGPPGGDL